MARRRILVVVRGCVSSDLVVQCLERKGGEEGSLGVAREGPVDGLDDGKVLEVGGADEDVVEVVGVEAGVGEGDGLDGTLHVFAGEVVDQAADGDVGAVLHEELC